MPTENQIPIVFGPVPSRRLGRSLGINNIPSKWCSYACVYCQVGNTIHLRSERRRFYDIDFIYRSVREKLKYLKVHSEPVDYLAFVPDGAPTLDCNLGSHIQSLKSFNIPIAVISNASLIFQADVQNDLMQADLVSLKVDTVNEATWKKINRAHGSLKLDDILNGILDFRLKYKGRLITETMLVKGMNDSATEAGRTSEFLSKVQPDKAYISIPTRPPAQSGIEPAGTEALNRVWQIFSQKLKKVELLTGYEGNTFASGSDFRTNILSVTAVHPMREDAVYELAARSGDRREIINQMVANNELVKVKYKNHVFYLRSQ